MPQNPHVIRKRTRDAGTAQQMADVARRLRKNEGQSTVIGQGATISAPSITTASGKNGTVPSGAMIVMQGNNGFYSSSPAGIYCTDSSGDIALYIQPGVGLVLESGTSEVNYISWYNGASIEGFVSVAPSGGGSLTTIASVSNGATMAISLGSYGSGSGAVGVYANGALVAQLSDTAGSAVFHGNVNVDDNLGVGLGFTAANGVVLINSAGQLEISSSGYASTYYLYFNTAHGTSMYTNVYPPSDKSLKENIADLVNGDEIAQLKPVSYINKETGERHIGFVAQDIDAIMPDATRKFRKKDDDKEYMAYDMNAIVAHLVLEVQQLRKQIEERTA
jgi:hypothetical protein